MNSTNFTLHRYQDILRKVIWLFLMLLITFANYLHAQANTAVKFLSEKFEATLITEKNELITKEAVPVTIQNSGDERAIITFCALPKGESECPKEGLDIEIVLADGNHSSIILEPGTIRNINLIGTIKLKSTDVSRGKTIVEQTGLLILQSNGKDAAAIPYIFSPESPDNSLFDNLVIFGALIIALFAIIKAIYPILIGSEPEGSKKGLSILALLKLPMGVAEWKLDSSWAANLSIAIGILAGVSSILPDTLKAFKTEYSSLGFLFTTLTLIGAFAYNSTTRIGSEKEKGKETSKKQGYTGVFLLTSLLIVWSLVGQLGLQMMAVEQLRNTDKNIPGLFLVSFEVGLFFLVVFFFFFTASKLKKIILDQKIENQKNAYKQRREYKKKIKCIKKEAHVWVNKDSYQNELKKIKENFEKIVPKADEMSDEDYKHFSALFNENLPRLLNDEKKSIKDMQNLFTSIVKYAEHAEELIKQALPIEDVVAAFYPSLWIPSDLRKRYYLETINEITQFVKVACAQAKSGIEPDMVLGPNQELFPNIAQTLEELNKKLGFVGNRDPYYANLKKLFEEAKMQWEILPIDKLQKVLCNLITATILETCKSNLENLFKAISNDTGNALANSLEPLADALGKTVPYPKSFPVDIEELDSNEKYQTAKKEVETAKRNAQRAMQEQGTADEVKSAKNNLKKIVDTEISGYSVPNEKSSDLMLQALHENSMLKVEGENVQIL